MITLVVSEELAACAVALLVAAGCWLWCLWDVRRNPRRPSPLLAYPWVFSMLERPTGWDLEALNRDYLPDTGRPRRRE